MIIVYLGIATFDFIVRIVPFSSGRSLGFIGTASVDSVLVRLAGIGFVFEIHQSYQLGPLRQCSDSIS